MNYQGWIGPSGAGRSASADVTHTWNMYLEASASDPRQYTLYSMPGLQPWLLLPSAPVRGLFETSTGRTFAVTSTTLFELFSGATFLSRGTVHTGTNPVFFSDNGIHLVLSVDGVGYAYDLSTDVLTALPLTGPQTFGRLAYIDGFILTNEPGTKRFWYSAPLDALTWDPLAFYSAEGRPDDLVSLLVDHRQIFLLGTQTVEVWDPTGVALSPFARNQTVFLEQGGTAPAAIVAANNTFFWLGGSPRGEGPIWRLEGYTPRRISTGAIETAMGAMDTVGDAVAFAVSWGGHSWVGWDFPTGNQTWLFDTNLEAWTELADLADDGTLAAFRCYTHAYSAGEHIWGDRTSGQVYLWSEDWHRYGQKERYCARVGPFLRQENERFRIHKVELLAEAGIGLDGGVVPGSDPAYRLAITPDGVTWNYERWCSAGKIGQRDRRVIWRQLGMWRQAALRIATTEPCAHAWRSVSLEVS